MFLWLWLGPTKSNYLNLVGIALTLVGVPLQVWDARRIGRPGYPWKLGITLAALNLVMWKDLLYRERYDGPLGKSDRAFCFGVIGAGVATGLLPALWINLLLSLLLAHPVRLAFHSA